LTDHTYKLIKYHSTKIQSQRLSWVHQDLG